MLADTNDYDELADTNDYDEDYTPLNEDRKDYLRMVELYPHDGKSNQSKRQVKGNVSK